MKRIFVIVSLLAGMTACAHILGFGTGQQRLFEHRAHVLKGVSCLQCHAGVESAGDEGPVHIPDTAACLSCHKQPHDTNTCSNCHGLPAAREAAAAARHHLKFAHQSHTPRVNGNCVRCHVEVRTEDQALRPKMATCFSCHKHTEGFDTRKCDTCHVDLREQRVLPQSHVIHDGDWLRSHGAAAASAPQLCTTCHAESSCASCHGVSTPLLAERMAFDDPLRAGVHRAGFRSRHAQEARSQPGLCESCHRVDFCTTCHAEKRVGAAFGGASPHPPGWLGLPGQQNDHGPAAWRNAAECASCHSGAGEMLCVNCHRVGGVGGNPHPPGWSTTRSRTDVPCRLCHTGTP